MSSVAHPQHQAQREGRGRLPGQPGRGAEQDQPQPLVHHRAPVVRHHPLRVLLQLGLDGQHREPAGGDGLGPEPVEHPAAGGREQPGRRVVRDPRGGPVPGRRLEGVRQPVLGQLEPAVLRDEQGQQPAPLARHTRSSGPGPGTAHPGPSSTTGLTSTV